MKENCTDDYNPLEFYGYVGYGKGCLLLWIDQALIVYKISADMMACVF